MTELVDHYANRTLFLVLMITPESRAKVCAQWRMSYFVIFVGHVVDQLHRLGKRELIDPLLFNCNYVVSLRFPRPLGAWDGLRNFMVALPEPSI